MGFLLSLLYASPFLIIFAIEPVFVFFTWMVALTIGILPSTVLGLLTGGALGAFFQHAKRAFPKPQAALIGSSLALLVVPLLHLGIALWEWPRRFFFSSYWLTLGVPSIVYVLASGWMGTRLCGSILSDSADTRGGVGSDWVLLGLGGGLVVSGCVLIGITLLRTGVATTVWLLFFILPGLALIGIAVAGRRPKA